MAPPNSVWKLGTLTLIYRRRILSNNAVINPLMLSHRRLRFIDNISTGRIANSIEPKIINTLNDDKDKVEQPPATPAPPPRPGFPFWVKWLFGSILSLVLPFCKRKWDNLLLLEGKAEKILEEVETVAEVVEKVAATTEKVSADMADRLSDDTKIKEAVLAVEHLSTVTAKDAQLTTQFLRKVGDIEEDLKELKTIVEPLIHTNPSLTHQVGT